MSTPNQLNTVKRGEFMSKLQSNFQLLRAKKYFSDFRRQCGIWRNSEHIVKGKYQDFFTVFEWSDVV